MRYSETADCEWSLFWHSDQLQSCSPAQPADIDELTSAWQTYFAAAPKGASVVDLGCGNGSLVSHAVAISRRDHLGFKIHGVDLADIQPEKFVSDAASILQDVIFHAKTPLEKLPFETASFDLVVSQYALEYSDITLSLAEAMRILKSGGSFRFLLHAETGILKQTCQRQQKQAETILKSPLFSLMQALLKALNLAEQASAVAAVKDAETAILALKDCFDQLEAQFQNEIERSLIDSLFFSIRRLPELRKTTALGSLLAATEQIEALLEAQQKRLAAMEKSALSAAQIEALANQLSQAGALNVSFSEALTGEQQSCVGYWLSGNRI